jgi:prepilin-type N-terminal cleavage/methylation domain-containing protein
MNRRNPIRQRGLTLVEIAVAMVVMAVSAFGIAASMMTGVSANRRYQQNTIVVARAQHYLETLYNLQIGTDADPAANEDSLELIFSGEPEIGQNPPSLLSLAKTIDGEDDDRYTFTPPNLGFPGQFAVTVSNNVIHTVELPTAIDSDDDGLADDGAYAMADATPVEQVAGAGVYEDTADDNSRELFCFEIWWLPAQPVGAPPQLVFRGYRAQDP